MTDGNVYPSDTLSGLFGAPLRRLEVVESTNSLLKAEAELGRAVAGAVIVAEHQTAGRGRMDRRWEAPPGKGLLFSVLLYPDLEPDRLPLVGLMIGLSVCQSIGSTILQSANRFNDAKAFESDQNSAFRAPQSALTLKWPNDILAGGRKLCGILCESGVDPQGRRFIVAGVGLNVNQTIEDLSSELRRTATSLYLITGATQPRDPLLGSILKGIESGCRRLQTENSDWVIVEWLQRSESVGKRLTVSLGTSKREGICEGLEPNGALRLRVADGSLKIIHSGDVI